MLDYLHIINLIINLIIKLVVLACLPAGQHNIAFNIANFYNYL